MLQTAMVAVRDRQRLQEIVGVLLRHGLGDVARRLRLAGWLPAGGGDDALSAEVREASTAQRLRMALEQLGPTFVKLGQMLATRADLLPPEWTRELERLHAAAAPVPWEEIGPRLEADLGGPVDGIFPGFAHEPIAAASMAQVYRAQLPDGRAIALKVRRPGLRRRIDADLRLLGQLVALAAEHWPALTRYRPREVLAELHAALREEMDLTQEARNTEAVAAELAGRGDVCIPRIHWAYTTERVLAMDFVEGVTPGDSAQLAAQGLDGPRVARRGAQAFLQMVLDGGVFHADPHPGNLFALPGDRVAFIDFGMVGRLSPRRREQLLSLLAAIVGGDADALVGVMLDLSEGGAPDVAALAAGAERFVARHGGGVHDLVQAIDDFMAIVRGASLYLPADLALLFKALATADGMLRRLDPALDLVATVAPMVRSAMAARYSAGAVGARGRAAAAQLYDMADDLPQVLRLVLHHLKQGRVHAEVEVRHFDRIADALERAATRLAIAIVAAAFVLGLAPRVLGWGPTWGGIPVFGLLGLALTVAALIVLLWTFRHRR
ncbi:ABC1 kinase family protein [Xenophilus azovorans]|uniref:ABC1 kinase family protein n=1 Tax=Xenophilus azovorans TaxID=151755 RepID=UPI00056F2209|nr:AarF/UbiB family protein [Xenophilus azovorans]